jgi:energy-coupling factor transporter ATP-binding protein EcfA2
MPSSSSSLAKKVMSFTFKLLGTALIWIGTAILTKMQLAPTAKDWQATLQQLPLWALLALGVGVPLAWLLVEFAATCFIEVRARVLDQTAPRFARWLTELPNAGLAVLGRWWDTCLAYFGRCRFDGRYRKRIAEECQQLHTQTGLLHATAGFSLEQAYTELNMASTVCADINQSLLASGIRGRESIYGFLRMQQPGTALALLGRPGGGKTTLLRHLALLYSQSKQGQFRLRRRIPIVVELRRVTNLFTDNEGGSWKSPTLTQVIQHYWKQHSALGGLMVKAPTDWLKRRLASGRVLVMIDGLDEVPHRPDPSDPHSMTPRQRVSRWMENEMQREGQRDCLFLITSRPGGFAEAPLKQRATVVEVQPLTLEQSERFIYSFQLGCQRKKHPTAKSWTLESEAYRATEKLLQELRGKPHLADLRVNPLLLHMVCLLHHLRGRLPADRSDLYKETCDVLLNRDLRAPGIEERLRPEDKLAALRPLADYFMRSQSPEAKSTGDLLPVIQPVFNTLNFPASDFFDYAAKDSGLLQEVEHGRWDFAHKTFYEYLTAEHWERHPPSKNDLVEWVEQDWWRVTLLFYSARSEDSPVIATALASRTPKAWSLAFACLTAGHRLNAAERARANTHLEKALASPASEDSFTPAAQALMDLRMREAVSASSTGKWLRRSTLITQAEYQLFLLSRPKNERWRFVPPHWTSEVFKGDPIAPVLGVTSRQAFEFGDWAATTGEQAWRLPTFSTWPDLPDGCWVVHESSGGFRCGALIVDKTGQIRDTIARWAQANSISDRTDLRWQNLLEPEMLYVSGGFSSSFYRLMRPYFDLRGRLLRLAAIRTHRYTLHLGVSISCEITTATTSALQDADRSADRRYSDNLRYHEYMLHRGRRIAEYRNLGEAFFTALNLHSSPLRGELSERGYLLQSHRDMRGDVLSFCKLICQGMLSDGRYGLSADADFPDSVLPERAEQFIEELEHKSRKEPDGDVVNRCRFLVAALKVIVTQHQPLTHRHAWVRYGLCLVDLCLPHMNAAARHFIRPEYVRLKLLEARIMSRGIEPWESILLVREV